MIKPREYALAAISICILFGVILLWRYPRPLNDNNSVITYPPYPAYLLTPSITDTSLGYDLNHTVQLVLHVTLANRGLLDVSFRGLSSTILVGGKQVRLTNLGNLTLMAGGSLNIDNSEMKLNVTDSDESLYRALKSRNLSLEVDFIGVAEAGGVTRNITLHGNSTTGFLHGPGEGPIGPADLPLEGPLNSIGIPHASQRYMSLVGILTSARISASLTNAGSIYNQTIDALVFEVTNTGPPWTFIIINENTHMPRTLRFIRLLGSKVPRCGVRVGVDLQLSMVER